MTVETLKLFLMSESVTQVPGLTMEDCEILDHLRELGVRVVQSPVQQLAEPVCIKS